MDTFPRMDAFSRFFLYLEGERSLSPHTRLAYQRDLATLSELAAGQDLFSLTSADIRSFVRQLSARGLSGRSISRTLSAWRVFYRLCYRDQVERINPIEGVRSPRTPKKLPATMTADAVVGFLNQFTGEGILPCRDKAIFELIYSSGLRVAELVSLRLRDLDFIQGIASVTGKGSKTRLVPIGSVAITSLRAWLLIRPTIANTSVDTVFVSRHGQTLTTRAIQARLKYWQLKIGIHESLYPHKLRHSCASHLLQSAHDLRAVQELLGHASIATTQIYTYLDFQHLANIYDATHPRAKKG